MILVPCPSWWVQFRSSDKACLIALIFFSSFFDMPKQDDFCRNPHVGFRLLTWWYHSIPWASAGHGFAGTWGCYDTHLVVIGPFSNMASSSLVLSLKGFVLLVNSFPSWLSWLVDCLPPFWHGFYHCLYQMILFPSWCFMTMFSSPWVFSETTRRFW